MKCISGLFLIIVILLSGCSKTGQTTSTAEALGAAAMASTVGSETPSSATFAYLPFTSGRIESYQLVGGILSKTGEVRVGYIAGGPIASPDGRNLYVVDDTQTITRFTTGDKGELLNPTTTKPDLSGQHVDQYALDPSGKFLFLRTVGLTDEDRVVGAIVVLRVASDGTLGKPLDRLAFNEVVVNLVAAPEGGRLLVSTHSGLKKVSFDSGGKLARTELLNLQLGMAENITFASDASVAALATYREFADVVLVSMDQNKVVALSSARMPYAVGGSIIESIALDDHSNVAATNFSRWLCVFRVQNNQLVEAGRYMIFKNHRVAFNDEALQSLKAHPEYDESYEMFANKPGENSRSRAEFASAFYHASIIDSVRLAPDGDVYASCTSGVYRFKSTAAGLSYAGPAVTWNDTADKFTGKHRSPGNEQMNARPVDDGMIFVQRK